MSGLPTIQISVANELLPEDLRILFKEAEQLRDAAEKIVCECNELDCPFKKRGSTLLLEHNIKTRVPSRGAVSDCEYVTEEEDETIGEPVQFPVFLRTQPGRMGTAPNRRRGFMPKSRARAESVPNKLTVPRKYERFYNTATVCLSSSA